MNERLNSFDAKIADQHVRHNLKLLLGSRVMSGFFAPGFEHAVIPLPKHIKFPHDRGHRYTRLYIFIFRKQNFYVADDAADMNFRQPIRNGGSGQIDHGITDQMIDIQRSQPPIGGTDMNIPDKTEMVFRPFIGSITLLLRTLSTPLFFP